MSKQGISNLEILRGMDKDGTLKPLITSGIVPSKVLTYMEMFYMVDAKVKTGESKTQSVCMTAAIFNVSPKCVWCAIRALK